MQENNSTTLCGFKVYNDKSGRKYICVHENPGSVMLSMPRLCSKYVNLITYRGTFNTGFQVEGIYKYGGARAFVETSFVDDLKYQRIEISARSIKKLREIHSLIRTGNLDPVEDWS